jgi:two-component system response regulator FixJ
MIEVSSHHERLPSPAKPTVFVVDDDAAVLGSLRFLLETDGFAVRTFRSGTALLNAGGAPGADCYVIDYKMPDINGIELRRRHARDPDHRLSGREHLDPGRRSGRKRRGFEAASR